VVRDKLLEFARDFGIDARTRLGTRVDDVREDADGSFVVISTDLATDEKITTSARFLCVTCGILTHDQWTLEERGVHVDRHFGGQVVQAAKLNGVDCPLGTMDLTDKKVVVLGSGSFAAEAFEAAERAGCDDITVVGRPRYRLVLPFSRQYTVSAIANAPFVAWSIRMRIALRYVKQNFYRPCNLLHWAPSGDPGDMDFSGQCNDAYFRLAYEGKLKCVVDDLFCLSDGTAYLRSGDSLPCDVVVCASGLKYNMSPSFLKSLGTDFTQLHNFAFLGRNPRIGCAADFLFAYVPYGPLRQLDMFFHAIACCDKGMEDQMRAALKPTPLPNHGEGYLSGGRMAGSYTFFEYEHWWSMSSKAVEARFEAMLRTLDVGRSPWAKLVLRAGFVYENTAEWFRCVRRSFVERRRFPVFGRGRGRGRSGSTGTAATATAATAATAAAATTAKAPMTTGPKGPSADVRVTC